MRKVGTWYRWLRGEGTLVRIGVAIGGMLALALAIAAVVALVGLRLLHFREFRPEPDLAAGTLYDLLKVAFAVAAGVGGVVALVTAYRRQRVAEFTQDLESTRLLNERFTTAAGQLGDDKPAVRLAGVYAMAGLADDWPQKRQTCVDVLCAYLRMPYEPDPGPDAPAANQQEFRALREVRHTAIRVIAAHLRYLEPTAGQDWCGLDLDFTGVTFDDASFAFAEFSGGRVIFAGAKFSGGGVNFGGAKFSGAIVSFDDAEFCGGGVGFGGAEFSGGRVSFYDARFSGGTVSFDCTEFSGGGVIFRGAKFCAAIVGFGDAEFCGAMVSFDDAEFCGGTVSFHSAEFSGGTLSFDDAELSGGTVDFSHVAHWKVPPLFPESWTATPPPGLLLPPAARRPGAAP